MKFRGRQFMLFEEAQEFIRAESGAPLSVGRLSQIFGPEDKVTLSPRHVFLRVPAVVREYQKRTPHGRQWWTEANG